MIKLCEKPHVFAIIVIVVLSHETDSVTSALLECLQCRGINCQRTSYNVSERCEDELDVCTTVFDRQIVQAQGCLLQLPQELRRKCDAAAGAATSECHKCNTNHCNTLGPSNYECIQCDSNVDNVCRLAPETLPATRCAISRATTSFCFVQEEGQRTVRGCAGSLAEQRACLERRDCLLCSPFEISECNRAKVSQSIGDNETESGSGNESGGSNTANEVLNSSSLDKDPVDNSGNNSTFNLNNTSENHIENGHSESGSDSGSTIKDNNASSSDNGSANQASNDTSHDFSNNSDQHSTNDSGNNSSDSGSTTGSGSGSASGSQQSGSGAATESGSNSLGPGNGATSGSSKSLLKINKIQFILCGVFIMLIFLK